MDQGLLTGTVFIDMRKAFDAVKKPTKGCGKELGWFKDYLPIDYKW